MSTFVSDNTYVVVSPGPGKEYKHKSAAVQDWRAGHDFKLESLFAMGTYCNNQNFKAGTKVEIRFGLTLQHCVIINN